jgi:hypothetical protein
MGSNVYFSFPPLGPGASGPQPALDLVNVVAPPSGLEESLTFVCRGQFTGEITVEGGIDGVNFDPIVTFRAGPDGPGSVVELPAETADARVAFLRLFVRATIGQGGVQVTGGGEQNCDCPDSGEGGCPIVALDEDEEKEQTGPTPTVVVEWSMDFGNLLSEIGPFLSAIVTGITRTDQKPSGDNFFWQLQIGGTPGAADGAVIASLSGAFDSTETERQMANPSFATPLGQTLVKLVLNSQSDNGPVTAFVRGQVVQFSCPIPE